jgi:dihydropteroate synthase
MVLSPRRRFVWRLRTRSLELGERTAVMAIINVTPDSFSGDGLLRSPGDGDLGPPRLQHLGSATATKLAVAAAVEAIDAGADIVDLGAESTRPGATPLDSEEEQERLLPVIQGILHERPDAVLSVDTYHADTALAAARLGTEIINDVSGLRWDEEMAKVAASAACGLILMHTRGRPQQWASLPALTRDTVVPTVFQGLCDSLVRAEAANIATARIVLDPGFGFGKRGTENFTLLSGLSRLHELGRPLLAGLSRKGFLGEAVRGIEPANTPASTARRTATIAANTACVLAGAHILRVHDVRAAREAAAVADALLHEATSAAFERQDGTSGSEAND